MPDVTPRYDPAHDLAVVLGSAMRQGYHGPAARSALQRLAEALGITEYTAVSSVEEMLRERLAALYLGPRLPADDVRQEFMDGVEQRMRDFAPPGGPPAGYSGAI